jgi:hypothetical protein
MEKCNSTPHWLFLLRLIQPCLFRYAQRYAHLSWRSMQDEADSADDIISKA